MKENNRETTPVSHLASVLNAGEFAVAAELSPPKGVNLESIARDAGTLREYADAVNVTDNQAASVRMASTASGGIIRKPRMCMT
jgi:5,10-methylenetetrahydrofolate reductase